MTGCDIKINNYVISVGVWQLIQFSDEILLPDTPCVCLNQHADRLVGLVVKVSASGAEDPGFESRLRRDFAGSSHTSDLKIGTSVATLPGAWHHRVSAGTGRPGVSIL